MIFVVMKNYQDTELRIYLPVWNGYCNNSFIIRIMHVLLEASPNFKSCIQLCTFSEVIYYPITLYVIRAHLLRLKTLLNTR